jgi:hypothetical protein
MEKKEKGAGEYNITVKKEKFFIFYSSIFNLLVFLTYSSLPYRRQPGSGTFLFFCPAVLWGMDSELNFCGAGRVSGWCGATSQSSKGKSIVGV